MFEQLFFNLGVGWGSLVIVEEFANYVPTSRWETFEDELCFSLLTCGSSNAEHHLCPVEPCVWVLGVEEADVKRLVGGGIHLCGLGWRLVDWSCRGAGWADRCGWVLVHLRGSPVWDLSHRDNLGLREVLVNGKTAKSLLLYFSNTASCHHKRRTEM